MSISPLDLAAAEAYIASPEATPEGIDNVVRYVLEQDLPAWLEAMFPVYTKAPFGPHHLDFWHYIENVQADARPKAFFALWNRGGAKSTSAELACVVLGALGIRSYGLYVGGVQESADDHVGNVAGMLESPAMERYYPALAKPALNKFGNSKGWRRNRIRTASGFTLDALGLDTAVRGVKLDEKRPDFIILDDIDDTKDSLETIEKKLTAITKGLLPAGDENLLVLGIQNLIHRDGIFARVLDGRADFLRNRIVSGPVPGLIGFKYEVRDGRYVITAGEPTWEGFSLHRCEELLNDIGAKAFLTEVQHNVYEVEGALWRKPWIDEHREQRLIYEALNPTRTLVGVDPAVSATENSDSTGIIVACKSGNDGEDYVLARRTCVETPLGWAKRVAKAYDDFQADYVVAEENQGGDLVKRNIQALRPDIPVKLVRATRGKALRAEPVAQLYERGRVHHMTTFMYPEDSLEKLEEQMLSWTPTSGDSPDDVDALTYVITELSIGGAGTVTQSRYVDNRRRGYR